MSNIGNTVNLLHIEAKAEQYVLWRKQKKKEEKENQLISRKNIFLSEDYRAKEKAKRDNPSRLT